MSLTAHGIDRSTPTLASNRQSDCWHSQHDHEAAETDQAKHPRDRDREREEVHVARLPEYPLAGQPRSEEGLTRLENHDAVAGGRVETCGGIYRRLVVAVMTDDEATSVVAGVQDSSKAPDVFRNLDACGRHISLMIAGPSTPRPIGSPFFPGRWA
jgi:hypothetical protein